MFEPQHYLLQTHFLLLFWQKDTNFANIPNISGNITCTRILSKGFKYIWQTYMIRTRTKEFWLLNVYVEVILLPMKPVHSYPKMTMKKPCPFNAWSITIISLQTTCKALLIIESFSPTKGHSARLFQLHAQSRN